MSNGNGSAPNRLLWWVVAGILGPIVLAVFSHATSTIYSSAQRITRVEAEQEDSGRRLERIERKLDQLLERRQP
jgi:hypothetical protein